MERRHVSRSGACHLRTRGKRLWGGASPAPARPGWGAADGSPWSSFRMNGLGLAGFVHAGRGNGRAAPAGWSGAAGRMNCLYRTWRPKPTIRRRPRGGRRPVIPNRGFGYYPQLRFSSRANHGKATFCPAAGPFRKRFRPCSPQTEAAERLPCAPFCPPAYARPGARGGLPGENDPRCPLLTRAFRNGRDARSPSVGGEPENRRAAPCATEAFREVVGRCAATITAAPVWCKRFA